MSALRGASDEVRARWLLGHLLQYHRREAKPHGGKSSTATTMPIRWRDSITGDRRFGSTRRYRAVQAQAAARSQHGAYVRVSRPAVQSWARKRALSPHTQQPAGDVIAIDDDNKPFADQAQREDRPEPIARTDSRRPARHESPTRLAIARVAAALEAARFAHVSGNLRHPHQRRAAHHGHRARHPDPTRGHHRRGDRAARAVARSQLSLHPGAAGQRKVLAGGHAIASLLGAGFTGRHRRDSAGMPRSRICSVRLKKSCAERGITFAGLHKHSGDENAYVSKLRGTDDREYRRQHELRHDPASGSPPAPRGSFRARICSRTTTCCSWMKRATQRSATRLRAPPRPRISCCSVIRFNWRKSSQGSHPLGLGPSVLRASAHGRVPYGAAASRCVPEYFVPHASRHLLPSFQKPWRTAG